ncbi:DNA polymerase [Magnetococcales bacterium HHB-1]
MTIHIDFETYSAIDLRKVGVHRYAEHPTTDIWCVAYAVDSEPVQLWTPGDPCPEPIQQTVQQGVFVAHNAHFEVTIWRDVLCSKHGWPEPKPEQWRCTMAMAMAMSFPASLEQAAMAAGLDVQKDMKGRALMLQMSKPRRVENDGTITWWDDDVRKQRLFDYCKQDVEVERALEKRLMPLSAAEQQLWHLDQKINRRGVHIDVLAADAATNLVKISTKKLNNRMRDLTKGAVKSCNQSAALIQWLQSQNTKTSSVAKAEVTALLKDETLSPTVREALELRQEAAKSSTAKLKKMLEVSGEDSRARGLFQYHGASTGRWSGRLLQTQNFPRPSLKQSSIEDALKFIFLEHADAIEMIYGPVIDVVSSCLRAMITAAPGYEFIAADYSAIEARVVAWLAGEERVLEVFRGHGKIYEHAAAGIYDVNIDEVTKDQRFIGKISVLALGYGGGVKAFQSMAKAYGVDIDAKKADEIKTAWRETNLRIVQFWSDLENAAVRAIRYPGQVFRAGRIAFRVNGHYLWCRLPSGRLLCYPYPSIEKKETPWGKLKSMVVFKGVNSISRKWGKQHTYGGKLAENVTQAVSRDLLAEALVRLETNGYPVVMHIHDEIVCEVPEGTADLKLFEALMAATPSWAEGLPVNAEGWVGKRFRK